MENIGLALTSAFSSNGSKSISKSAINRLWCNLNILLTTAHDPYLRDAAG
jgi:hypothetical protein